MISLSIAFTAGRYHATPWGRHVNEGAPEWPPSPWRILRALVATWKRTMPDVTQAQMERLLVGLSAPPDFYLPSATLSHSRHFLVSGAPGYRPLVLDAFVAMNRDEPVLVVWPDASLEEPDRALLARLADNLPYLGRSQSWCRARLADGGSPNCRLVAPDGELPEDCEPVRVLGAASDVTLGDLLVETSDLRLRHKRIDPPGSRILLYARPRGVLLASPGRSAHPIREQAVSVVRYALDAKPLPLLVDTVRVAEVARRSAMAQYGRANAGASSPTLSGKDESGQPLKGHVHAFYLPTDEDEDGRLDHLTIVARARFTLEEQAALAGLRVLNLGQGREAIRLLLLGFAADPGEPSLGSYFRPSRVHTSRTPFVMARHPKRYRTGAPKLTQDGRQKDGPEDQIVREWESRRRIDPSLPELTGIQREPAAVVRGHRISWLDFRRWREHGNSPAAVAGACGFTLTFASEVRGPIALGYASHYGLGLFKPTV